MPKFVVLGAGPTGLFAADWISQNIDSDVVTVGASPMGMLKPVVLDDRVITMSPIFPQRNQVFPRISRDGPDLVLAHVGTAKVPEYETAPASRSYAARAMRDYAPASLSLAWKQFGRRIWLEPLVEVQRKVDRTYSSVPAKHASRIGYVAGESPYAHELRAMIRRLRVISARPISITSDHVVILNDQTRLPYQYLVNTISLPDIARVLNLPDPMGSFAGARFAIAKITSTRPSQLVYDLDPHSPIFRVLTPCADIAVMQLSLSYGRASHGVLRSRLEQLLTVEVVEFYPHSFFFRQSYPLDPPVAATAHLIASTCASYDITNIGRFAEWRYVDLHEISWEERLRCL